MGILDRFRKPAPAYFRVYIGDCIHVNGIPYYVLDIEGTELKLGPAPPKRQAR